MPERDDVDRMLDSALSSYATPAPDFKERLLRSLASALTPASPNRHRSRPRHSWLRWVIALPAAACILVGLVMLQRTPQTPKVGTQQARSAPAVPRAALPALSPAPPQPRLQRALHPSHASLPAFASGPKRDMFPTPQPLTPLEESFVAYAKSAPESDRRALLSAQQHENAPLSISAIQIPPITPEPVGK
jgi:hypothetical protein